MRLRAFPLLALASISLFASALLAQTFTPHSIVFEGAPQYQQQDLLAASGLQLNKPVTQADLDASTQRLGDIGVFTNITFTTSGTTLKFSLESTPADQMRKVVFTNFVMFEPAELTAAVHQRVPLFNGSVPVSGSMQQTIERALEAILKDRGINASVSSIGGAGHLLDYAIASPPVKVQAITIDGADFAGTSALRDIRDRVVGSDFLTGISGPTLRSSLLDAYADLGLQDASVTPITHSPPQIAPDRITVTLTGSATPGPLYRVSRLTLPSPAPGVAAAEINAATQIKPGDPASRIQVLSTQARISGAFETHGYLDAATTFEAAKDSSTHTIAYTFNETPGEIYHMRNLIPKSLSPEQLAVVKEAWRMGPGAVFQGLQLYDFIHKAPGATLCSGRPIHVERILDRPTHQVDVVLSCIKGD